MCWSLEGVGHAAGEGDSSGSPRSNKDSSSPVRSGLLVPGLTLSGLLCDLPGEDVVNSCRGGLYGSGCRFTVGATGLVVLLADGSQRSGGVTESGTRGGHVIAS